MSILVLFLHRSSAAAEMGAVPVLLLQEFLGYQVALRDYGHRLDCLIASVARLEADQSLIKIQQTTAANFL